MARRRPRREVRRRFPPLPRADADVALKIPKSLDHDAIKWNRIMISYLRLSMIFSENRLPLCANAALRVRIMLWGRARACPAEATPDCHAGRDKNQIASAAATHPGHGPDRQIPRVLFACLCSSHHPGAWCG